MLFQIYFNFPKNIHKIPKYVSINNEIIKRIESGELQPDEKFPSENDLIKIYSIRQTTTVKNFLKGEEEEEWTNRIKGITGN